MRGHHDHGILTVWRPTALLLVAVFLTGFVGCSGKKPKKPAAGGAVDGAVDGTAGEPDAAPPAVDLGTALVVDEGKIAVASPTGWTRLPRSKDGLVKYQPGPKKLYPKILVTAADPPAGCEEVTAENHQAFAAGIAASLGQAIKPLKKPASVQIGPHLGVAWGISGSRKGEGPDEKIESWLYAVVIGGRMYTVEAWAPKGKIDAAGKAAAKAVAAALAPPQPKEPEEAPVEEPSATETPAAGEQPAEAEKPAAEDADK